jgi:hypothetical protein
MGIVNSNQIMYNNNRETSSIWGDKNGNIINRYCNFIYFYISN